MEGRMYGYARVSSKDQNLDRQLDAFEAFGVPRDAIFADKASGKDFDRPEYRRLVESLAEGDVVVIKSIDRLGRNYEEILTEWSTSRAREHQAEASRGHRCCSGAWCEVRQAEEEAPSLLRGDQGVLSWWAHNAAGGS